jgi:transposase-like protein
MTVVAAIQVEPATEEKLTQWLQAYQAYPVIATLSDGEERIIAALRAVWPNAPHQRCQEHFLSNLAEDVLVHDTQLRKQMRQDLGGLPKVVEKSKDDPFL